ncbi:hypothetical protein HHI36_019511 [Cryptolaemus montrouzieri]|uniref:G-patch domain-containing protein n=1 Tax=Cryptolaemus montrouzieri TaxID=559131 RepID=A0ABD2P350_9CUCU
MNEIKNEFEKGIAMGHSKPENHSPIIDEKALQMMKKMGYKPGIGLGRYEQGIIQAISVTPKTDVGGLGFIPKVEQKVEWDFSSEVITEEESLIWLENKTTLDFSFTKLQSF